MTTIKAIYTDKYFLEVIELRGEYCLFYQGNREVQYTNPQKDLNTVFKLFDETLLKLQGD